jgi:predicted TIM-barrel fold metal-dependent hydrolase
MMKRLTTLPALSLLSLSLLTFAVGCSRTNAPAEGETAVATPEYYTVEDYARVEKIDSHVHISTDDTTFMQVARADNFRLLTINVNSPSSPTIEEQRAVGIRLSQQFPGRVSYATTLSVDNFNEPEWEQQTIAYLKESFDKGAIGVKVWKNIGMDLKDAEGKFVMIDHPRFDPVMNFLEQQQKPLLSHQGEPRNCWLPVDEMTVENDKNYFTNNPQYHMYLHPEYPSYEDQIQARDRLLDKHPNLPVVSVHLASLEWSVDELSRWLDKYPHAGVDMAARIPHWQHQAVSDWQKVHDFLVKYQDRLLYATDLGFSARNGRTPEAANQSAHDTWLRDWRFFVSDEVMTHPSVRGVFKGMKLPREAVDKIFRQNAEKYLPGLAVKM